jgi:hypothetical protein
MARGVNEEQAGQTFPDLQFLDELAADGLNGFHGNLSGSDVLGYAPGFLLGYETAPYII